MNQNATIDQSALPEANLPAVSAGFYEIGSFELMQRVAKALSASELVPKIYQGGSHQAVGNCMVAINFARRINADPLMVMQNLNIIQGRPAWSSQFLIASVNTCGRFSALRFEFFGEPGTDGWGCRAVATERSTGEILRGSDITIGMAKTEGWYNRNGSKWKTMPQQMLTYRAGAFWTRAYAPELSMGLMTAEEARDVIDITPPSNGSAVSPAAPAAPEPPPSIASRLDVFAEDNTSSSDPAASSTPGTKESEETEAVAVTPSASQDTASSSSTALKDDEAVSDVDPKLKDAYERGRAARLSGYGREVPRLYNYKSRATEAAEFLRGWDDENGEQQAAESGSV